MFNRNEYSRAGLHLFKSVPQWESTDCIVVGTTHFEIESVREVHIVGGIDPSMNLRSEGRCDCQNIIKLLNASVLRHSTGL